MSTDGHDVSATDVPAPHVRAATVLPAAFLRHGLLPSGHGLRYGDDACTDGVRSAEAHDEAYGKEPEDFPAQAAPSRTG